MHSGKGILTAAVALFVGLLGCASTRGSPDVWLAADQEERIVVPTDSWDWKVGNSSTAGAQTLMEFVRHQESTAHWTELLSLHAATLGSNAPENYAKIIALRSRKSFEETCPRIVWSVLSESDTDVLYEWQHDGCQGDPPQHEIARVVRGTSAVFVVRYTRKVAELPAADRSQWLALIRAARLEKSWRK